MVLRFGAFSQPKKMETATFAIVHWIDKFATIINLEAIKIPRKPIGEYKKGDYVFATYGNSKKQYRARISEIRREYFGIFSPRSSARVYFGFNVGPT